jgi:hypothetical protein
MTHQEQVESFGRDLDTLVDRYCMEFDLDYASVVGMLEFKKHLLIEEAQEDDGEDQP